MESFNDLFQKAQNTDSYWTEKIILKFTNQIYRILNKNNTSKKEFAEKIGTSPAYITKALRGNANFTIETMVKLARALDASLEIQVIPKEDNVAWYKVISGSKRQTKKVEPWAVECHETPCSLEEGNNGYAIAS